MTAMSSRLRLAYTIGLPGSGKTTLARELIAQQPIGDAVRVNRDDLRAVLYGPLAGQWGDPRIENQITAIQHDAITAAWRTGAHPVVCDDTNLNPAHVRPLIALAKAAGADVEMRDLRDVLLEVCLERNAGRARPVPEQVIRSMHLKWIEPRIVINERGLIDQITNVIESFGNPAAAGDAELIAQAIAKHVIDLTELRADKARLERELDGRTSLAVRFLDEVLQRFRYGTRDESPTSSYVRSAPVESKTLEHWFARLEHWRAAVEEGETSASPNRPDAVQ